MNLIDWLIAKLEAHAIRKGWAVRCRCGAVVHYNRPSAGMKHMGCGGLA